MLSCSGNSYRQCCSIVNTFFLVAAPGAATALDNLNIMNGITDGRNRSAIQSGICVDVVQKQDQRSGKKTRGVVSEILTNSTFHPHGIKVRLKDGRVGRVCGIVTGEGE